MNQNIDFGKSEKTESIFQSEKSTDECAGPRPVSDLTFIIDFFHQKSTIKVAQRNYCLVNETQPDAVTTQFTHSLSQSGKKTTSNTNPETSLGQDDPTSKSLVQNSLFCYLRSEPIINWHVYYRPKQFKNSLIERGG